MELHHNRPVLVRTKRDLFHAVVCGEWSGDGLSGPMVRTAGGGELAIDARRIVRFTDTDEIPHLKGVSYD